MKPCRLLFLQLPQLDNDTSPHTENLMMAAAYLEHAVNRSPERAHHLCLRLPPGRDRASTPALLAAVLRQRPDVIAATLYLWNIEWTLRLLAAIRIQAPNVQIVVGGPEVAPHHPFLFRSGIPDVAVAGEGENVFPAILRALRTNGRNDYGSVATRIRGQYVWGRNQAKPVELADAIPPLDTGCCGPDANGMAYLESSRGCPMRCSYCRYAHLRRQPSFLSPEAVAGRVDSLQRLGAREIRFIDPTFNAHPQFRQVLQALISLNRRHRLRFFAELMAERLTPEDCALLAAANFNEIEVGMQSRAPEVLREIRRPTQLARLDRGIRLLSRHNITVTLDVMYALPKQTLRETQRTIQWSLRHQRANIQCLQTLLLPGTELRERRRRWKLASIPLPPYAVTATASMTSAAIATVEHWIARHPRLRSDNPTPVFVGRKLPGLFQEQVTFDPAHPPTNTVPGRNNRRSCLIQSEDLFSRRQAIDDFISRCIRNEPDGLFQFVLVPQREEPLDLLDSLIKVIREAPPHLVDRYASVRAGNRIASRRIRILLPPRRRFARDWIDAAEALLAATFF